METPYRSAGHSAGLGRGRGKNVTFTASQELVLYDLLETDAAINPGNSGGPLLNLEGEVIGITNAKLVAPQIDGVAFAISSQTFVPIIEDLVRHGVVRRPYLGVSLVTLTPDIASVLGLDIKEGALVSDVAENGPAAEAGLRRGDVIVGINGQEVNKASEVVRIIRDSAVGDRISITYIRDGEERTAEATLIERPSS